MKYALLADTTALVHLTTIVVVLVGLMISFRYKRFRPWEALILIVVVILWSYYGNCPFTILEQYFRDLAGQNSNLTSVGFLPYYASKIFDVSLSSRFVQRFTFFTGGAFFAASIEWFAPFFHMEIFKMKRIWKKLGRRKGLTKLRRV